MKTYESLEHCVYSCKNHIVFCPKYRRKVLISPIDTRLKELLNKKAKELNIEILEVEVMPDHVHILAELRPNEGIGVLVGQSKGFTSGILRQKFPELKLKLPNLWTNSYFVSSVGGSPLALVKKYIETQKMFKGNLCGKML